jgi:CO/xanthine dehydrogenase Mo-binding subunit
MKAFRAIGKPQPRLDGPDTVSGHAKYTVDILLPDMLHAKLFRSSAPHALIRSLDVERARSLSGVAAVLTARDVPRKRFGFTVQDEELLGDKKVRCIGDVIAAVAAEDENTATAALDLIHCEYEKLPAALTPDEALKENAPLIHQDLDGYSLNDTLARSWQPVKGTNIAHQAVYSRVPSVMPIIVEKPYSSEPYGAKGVGEMSLFGIAPATCDRLANRRAYQRFAHFG